MKAVDPKILEELEKHPTVTIGFSFGRDSVACMALLKELKKKIYPIYLYDVPDMSFIVEAKKMYEDIFETEIIFMPSPSTYYNLRCQNFQTFAMASYLKSIEWPVAKYEDIVYTYMDWAGVPNSQDIPDVVGIRAAESFNRRKVIEKYGAIREVNGLLKINMIHDWTKDDVMKLLKSKKIPLTKDYTVWNRSWDGNNYQWIIPMKEKLPEDYARLKEFFSLLDTEIKRYEFNQKYFQS